MNVYVKIGSKFINTDHLWYAESTLDDSSRRILRVWYTNGNRMDLNGADAAAMTEFLNSRLFKSAETEGAIEAQSREMPMPLGASGSLLRSLGG